MSSWWVGYRHTLITCVPGSGWEHIAIPNAQHLPMRCRCYATSLKRKQPSWVAPTFLDFMLNQTPAILQAGNGDTDISALHKSDSV